MKRKKILLILILLVVGLICLVLSKDFNKKTGNIPPETIADIAYDVNSSFGYTVYIKENNLYIPYLVLTDNYDNSHTALLLRKNIIGSGEIDTTRKNDWDAPSYLKTRPMYADSIHYGETQMDKYLNNEFLSSIDKKTSAIICDSKIILAQELDENLEIFNPEIIRKIFLLSSAELGYGKEFSFLKFKFNYGFGGSNDGKPAAYFKNFKNTLATFEDGKTFYAWWIRTPNGAEGGYNIVGINGELGQGGGTNQYFGVRPAFCLPNTTKIIKNSSIVEGESIYIIE